MWREQEEIQETLKKKVSEAADIAQSGQLAVAPSDLLKYVAWRTNQTIIRLKASQNNKTTSAANGSSNESSNGILFFPMIYKCLLN